MKTFLLSLLLASVALGDDYMIGISRGTNNVTTVALTLPGAPYPVVDFSLLDDNLNPDLRDYMGRDDKGRIIAAPRGPVPTIFPALINCDTGVVVPWTGTNAITNAVAILRANKSPQRKTLETQYGALATNVVALTGITGGKNIDAATAWHRVLKNTTAITNATVHAALVDMAVLDQLIRNLADGENGAGRGAKWQQNQE